MLYQGNVFWRRQPGQAESGWISAAIWGFIQLLWSQCKHLPRFGGSSLNRMWEAFSFLVFSLLHVCVHSSMCDDCVQISIRECVRVFSLTLRRKGKKGDSPQPDLSISDGWGQLKKENDVGHVCERQHLCFNQNYGKMLLDMSERHQSPGMISMCQPRTVSTQYENTFRQKYGRKQTKC